MKKEIMADGRIKITKAHSEIIISDPTKRVAASRSFGFDFSDAEERMYRRAINEANEFMHKSYSGIPARIHGEYFTPGENPSEKEALRVWVSKETALLYTHMKSRSFTVFCDDYNIKKRVYKRVGSKAYYEYDLDSINKAMKKLNQENKGDCLQSDARDSARQI